MTPRNQARMKKYSYKIFITSIVGIFVTAVVLYFGAMKVGGGHGAYGVWYFGIFLSLVVWALVLASCVTSIITWISGSGITWWALPSFFLFVGLTLLGLWGMKG